MKLPPEPLSWVNNDEYDDNITAWFGGLLLSRIMRVWRPYLTVHELTVLLFIMDRTVLMNKRESTIIFKEFLESSPGYPACGVSRATIRDAIYMLEARGMLKTRDVDGRTRYSIVVGWGPYKIREDYFSDVPPRPVNTLKRVKSLRQIRGGAKL